jgi:hypothetical protein
MDRHQRLGQRAGCEVAGGERLVRRGGGAARDGARLEAQVHGLDAAAVGVGDHLHAGIGVDADEPAQRDLDAGLLAHLARRGVRDRLADLDVAAGQAPAPVVAALHQQQRAAGAGVPDDGRDREADRRRVRRVVRRARADPLAVGMTRGIDGSPLVRGWIASGVEGRNGRRGRKPPDAGGVRPAAPQAGGLPPARSEPKASEGTS